MRTERLRDEQEKDISVEVKNLERTKDGTNKKRYMYKRPNKYNTMSLGCGELKSIGIGPSGHSIYCVTNVKEHFACYSRNILFAHHPQ